MNYIKEKKCNIVFSVIFGVIVFLFWYIIYPYHLAYHEQFQLFLFDAEYFNDRITIPGGFANYIAEFLTQFYHSFLIGALIIVFLYLFMQKILWKLLKEQGVTDIYYPLSFLPIIALWHFMVDENAMLSFDISILFSLLVCYVYTFVKKKNCNILYILFAIPTLYWIAGSSHFIFIVFVIIYESLSSIKNKKYITCFVLNSLTAILGIACPLLARYFLQYPIYKLMSGIWYYRFPDIIPFDIILIIILFTTFPFVLSILPEFKKRKVLYKSLIMLVVSLFGYYYVISGCDMDKEESMEYDYLVRNRQWMNIIEKAQHKSPTSPFSVVCLNLSLAKTGQMGDRMFEFYQNGTEGLLSEFYSDFTSPLPTSEALYHLGIISMAQRYTFEAMESIPNYNKSTRCLKRLAETNIINGQYEVAAKYLRLLKKTIFYNKWAADAMTYLYKEEKINSHKEWGWLRQIRYKNDFLFNGNELKVMISLLYQQNTKNRMAYEYMMANMLLKRDIAGFMTIYQEDKYPRYDYIPRSYQEVLAYVWTQSHKNFEGIPWSISPNVMRDITEYAQIFTTHLNPKEILQSRFGKTYWNYLLLN